MIIQFDIPDSKLTRLANSLNFHGYTFVQGQGTDNQQRLAFIKKLTRDYWAHLVYQKERVDAVSAANQNFVAAKEALEQAEQAIQFTDFNDVI